MQGADVRAISQKFLAMSWTVGKQYQQARASRTISKDTKDISRLISSTGMCTAFDKKESPLFQ